MGGDGTGGRGGCDDNYGLGAYGMNSVHTTITREPERSRVTISYYNYRQKSSFLHDT